MSPSHEDDKAAILRLIGELRDMKEEIAWRDEQIRVLKRVIAKLIRPDTAADISGPDA